MPHSIDRIFIDWNRPALPEVAAMLALRYAGDREIELSGLAIAVPGGRVGRRLGELLVGEAQELGLPLIPPRIVTVGALPELLFEAPAPAAEPTLARLALARALMEEDPERIRGVFRATPARDDIAGWSAIAAVVLRLHREVAGGGHTFADVARLCASGSLLYDDHARWQTLSAVMSRYSDILDELGRGDLDFGRLGPHFRAREDAPAEVWLVGVSELPRVTRALLGRYQGRIHVAIHAPAAEAASFDDLGAVMPHVWGARRLEIEEATLSIVDRPGDQSAEVVRQLLALEGRYAPEEITVGVPDADLVPYLEQRLEEAGAPVRYAAGSPVAATGPFRLLEAVAEYLRTASWDSFAALRRHPDLPRFEAPGLAKIDRYHGKHLPASIAGDLPKERNGDGPLSDVRAALEGDRLLGGLRGRRPITAWQEGILGFLAECYGGHPLDRDDPRDRRLLATLESLRSVAVSFHSLPGRIDEVCDAATAIHLLLNAARAQAIPDDPDIAAIELLGWLEMHLDDAPVALVVGLNEPFLPESLNADAFLPDRLRSLLGLTDNAGRYARDAYQLTALIHSREHVGLIAGRMNATGDPLRPSRLMLATSGDELARRVHRFAGSSDGANGSNLDGGTNPSGGTSRSSGNRGGVGSLVRGVPRRRSSFQLPPDKVIMLDPPASISVTDFRLLLEDPFRYALERHLRLEAVDDSARELDGMGFGNLAHAVLESFGHLPEARSSRPAVVARTLDELLDAEATRVFGRSAAPAVAIQVEQLRARLRAFARWQSDSAAGGWEITFVEGALAGDPRAPDASSSLEAPFPVDGEPMTIRGRVDRIDHNPRTNEWRILDYKTGDSVDGPEKTHRSGRVGAKEWRDLQLPLYRHLAATILRHDGAPLVPHIARTTLQFGYILLPRDLEKVGGAMATWTADELDSADAVAADLIRTVRRGRYEFDAELAARYRRGPLAPLLGLRQLVLAEDEDEDEAELVAR